jgi:hypothetical protein
MSQFPYAFYECGTYVNAATPVAQNIAITDYPTKFRVKDVTDWGAATTAVAALESEWNRALPQGAYLQIGQISGSAGANYLYPSKGTSGGFTFIDQSHPPLFSKVAITAINGTTGVVLTGTTTGINVGDTVRLINVVGAQQISTILFTVTAVSAGVSITLGMLASAASAGLTIANGTTGFYQKVYPNNFYPNGLPVLYVTQATQAVVYFGRPNPYTPGELVDFQIPVPYGMIQLSNLTKNAGHGALSSFPSGAARVLSVTNSATVSSITIDVNTTGFTAFQYATSATVALGASPPNCFPAGSGIVPLNGSPNVPLSPPGTNLLDAFDNRNQYVMNVGLSVVGAASATMFWEAWRADHYNGVTNA